MEYNLDGMAPPQKPNIFVRAWQGITLPHYGRTIGFLSLLVIALSIPATIAFLREQTTLQQKAAQPASGGEKGSVDIFDASGNVQLTSYVSQTQLKPNPNPRVQLLIKRPEEWELAIQKSPPLAQFSPNIIKPAYASHSVSASTSCNGTNQNVAVTWTAVSGAVGYKVFLERLNSSSQYSGCLGSSELSYTFTNVSTTNSYQVGVMPYNNSSCASTPMEAAPRASVTNANCSGGGGGSEEPTPTATPRPTATPTPTQQPSQNQTRCTEVRVVNSTPPKQGETVFVDLKYTGQPASIKFWISNNNQSNKATAADVGDNWTFVDTKTPHLGTAYPLSSTADFTPGKHFVLAQLLNSQNAVVDEDPTRCGSNGFILEAGSQPTPTPTTQAPPSSKPKIVGIDIQNLGDPGSGETARPATQIRDQATITRILNGEKYPWDLYLPKFDQDIAIQSRRIEVTFWADNNTNKKIFADIMYAPFVLRFDTMNTSSPIPVTGKDLHVFVYGNQPTTNVKVKIVPPQGNEFTVNVPVNLPARSGVGGVISPYPCGEGTSTPTCAWQTPIPGDKITTPGIYTITFLSGPNESHNVSQAIDIRQATNQPPAPTATPVPGAPTTTPTTQPGVPTATETPPGAPTATPTATPTVTPTGTLTPSPIPTTRPGDPTATPTVTPVPPGSGSISFKVTLAGIGIKGSSGTTQATNNDDPRQTERDVTIYLYAPDEDATGDFKGEKATLKIQSSTLTSTKLVYQKNGTNKGKFVVTNFNLGNTFVPGLYQVFIWTPGYLRKRIPGIQNLKAQTDPNNINPNQIAALTLGDANGDNKLNLLDFNAYHSCLNKTINDSTNLTRSKSCLDADFNDDGYIDNDDKHNDKNGNKNPSFLDHALFTNSFALIDGD